MTIRRSLDDDVAGLIRWGEGGIRLEEIIVSGPALFGIGVIKYGKILDITLRAKVDLGSIPSNYGFGLAFRTTKGIDAITSTTIETGKSLPSVVAGDRIEVRFSLQNILAPGDYFIVANIESREQGSPRYFDFIENALQVKVISDFDIYSVTLPCVQHHVAVLNQKNEA